MYVYATHRDGFIGWGDTQQTKGATFYLTSGEYRPCDTVRVEYYASAYRAESGMTIIPAGNEELQAGGEQGAYYYGTVSALISHRLSNEDEPHYSKAIDGTEPEETTSPCADNEDTDNLMRPRKPVIYLYPPIESEITVTLDFNGTLTTTIPPYQDGWTVTASPDGTLTDREGNRYPYLFWEGVTTGLLPIDKGFCVRGEETEAFLLDILPRLGLIEREYTEFIDYWLPFMKNNPYNIISFQTDAYEALAPLTISPAPDAVLRVFMSFYASQKAIEIPAQRIEPFVRHGFTVVEWGGEERT